MKSNLSKPLPLCIDPYPLSLPSLFGLPHKSAQLNVTALWCSLSSAFPHNPITFSLKVHTSTPPRKLRGITLSGLAEPALSTQ
jgi:hypothetical protein